MFSKIGIVGLGLIGGSLAKVIRQQFPDVYIIAVDPNQEALKRSKEDGVISEGVNQVHDVSQDLELCMICTPISMINHAIQEVSDHCGESVLITDVASIKTGLGDTVQLNKGQTFIGGHPMAGTEHQGYDHTSADILRGATYILMESEHPQLKILTQFLETLSFQVITMSASEHDRVLALASHFPYLMASLTVKSTASYQNKDALKQIVSSGFRDTTRVASSPVQWGQDICTHNKYNLLELISQLKGHLSELEDVLKTDNESGLETFFTASKALKDQLN